MVGFITRISVIGITIITAALVVLLSAFNGIESLIERMYSDFDADLTIRYTGGKTFPEDAIDLAKLNKIEGVKTISRVVEETVVLKHEKKWVNAQLIAVDPEFLVMSRMKRHMVDGVPQIENNGQPMMLVGATLLDKLGGFIPERSFEQLIVFAPKREAKMKLGSNPFRQKIMNVSGRMNFNGNREVNGEKAVVPLEVGRELLNYENDLTAIYVQVKDGFDPMELKEEVKKVTGPSFEAKTNLEKNALIFKTSKSEKLIVLVILVFIFILAAFNLIASITMLFVEKKDNLMTMISFGAERNFVFRIFLFEGLLICARGIFYGLLIGYLVCFIQIKWEVLMMPGAAGLPFPVRLSVMDASIIIGLVTGLSVLFSYLPVRYLMRRNFERISF